MPYCSGDEVAASEGFLKAASGQRVCVCRSFREAMPKIFWRRDGGWLRKDDTELKAAFDKALTELRRDGTYAQNGQKVLRILPSTAIEERG